MADPVFECDFNDATVIADVTDTLDWDDPSQEDEGGAITLEETIIPRVGTKSLKCVAAAYASAVSRAAIQKAAFTFAAYSEAWIEWYIYITGASSYHMLGLLDVEDADHHSGLTPGRSLYMTGDRILRCALLRAGDPGTTDQVFTRNIEPALMPIAQWVKMRAYFFFDADPSSGRIKVWKDDVLVMDVAGRTMPPGMYVTDRIQLGITHHEAPVEQTVYIADVKVWQGEPSDGLSPPTGGRRKDIPDPEHGGE